MMQYKRTCVLCSRIIYGTRRKLFCGDCRIKRQDETTRKANRRRATLREFKKLKVLMSNQPYLVK